MAPGHVYGYSNGSGNRQRQSTHHTGSTLGWVRLPCYYYYYSRRSGKSGRPGNHPSFLLHVALPDFGNRAARAVVVQVSVVHPTVNSGFSEITAWIQDQFYGELPIRHISYFFLLNIFAFHFFTIFFFVFVNMGPYGSKNFKTLLILSCSPF